MDELKVLFYKYGKVLKNAVLLSTVFVAIFSKAEKIRSLSLGAASGILVIEFVESVDRLKKPDAEKVPEQ